MLKIVDEDGRVKFTLGDEDTEPQPVKKQIEDRKEQEEDGSTNDEPTDAE
jgi:hypothetical protein